MELADRREPSSSHLPVRALVEANAPSPGVCPSASASMPSRQAQKSPPAARPAERTLEGVAVRVHEAGKRDHSLPRATTLTYGGMQTSSSVSAPLRQLPNVLTILRFAAIPVFVVLLVRDQDGPELAGRDRLRARRDHRPARRLARPPLGRRVGLRQGRRSARRPADDRRLRRAARRLRPAALDRARDPAPRPTPGGRLQDRRPARLRVRGLTAREGRDLGALRVAGARAGHRA